MLVISLVLTTILFCSALVALSLGRSRALEPLAAYTVIMPGQTVEALSAYSCQPQKGAALEGIGANYCELADDDGFASAVTVVDVNLIITQIRLQALPDRLHVGDLVSCWGSPTTVIGMTYSGAARIQLSWLRKPRVGLPPLATVVLEWDDHIAAEVSPQLPFRLERVYFEPVTNLVIEEQAPPCVSRA